MRTVLFLGLAISACAAAPRTSHILPEGALDREEVAQVINAHLTEVSNCYENALATEPRLSGKLVLEWSVTTTGIVTARTATSTMASATVETCVRKAIETWKFPVPKDTTAVVTYPFVFNSVGYGSPSDPPDAQYRQTF